MSEYLRALERLAGLLHRARQMPLDDRHEGYSVCSCIPDVDGIIGKLLTREEAAADPGVVRVVREQDPLRRKIDDWAQAYPTSVFPEPDHKSTGHDPTLCSASMGRHILNTLQGYYETEATDDE